LTAEERHALIAECVAQGLSVRGACRWSGYSRAVGTYPLQRLVEDRVHLKSIQRVARANPRYGYRRVAVKSNLGFGQVWRL